jgi:hypothetical protein
MRAISKAAIVLFGYIGALAIACAVVAIYIATTNGPDRQQYAAMFDFGDSILFLAVLVLASVPATAAGLYFLRPHPLFWSRLSYAAILVAATGIAALLSYIFQRFFGQGGILAFWSALTPLRILAAPGFGLIFLLCAIFAPNRSARIILFVSTVTEFIAFIYVALIWFRPH